MYETTKGHSHLSLGRQPADSSRRSFCQFGLSLSLLTLVDSTEASSLPSQTPIPARRASDMSTFRADDFQPHINKPFTLQVIEGPKLQAQLSEVTVWPHQRGQGAASAFSLIFTVHGSDIHGQGLFQIHGPGFASDTPPLLLVTVAPDPTTGAARLEAVFN